MSQTIANILPAAQAPDHFEGNFGLDTEVVQTGPLFAGDGALTFGDFLDIINPLQHLPLVSTIYRAITGDDISVGSRAAGALIYGGRLDRRSCRRFVRRDRGAG